MLQSRSILKRALHSSIDRHEVVSGLLAGYRNFGLTLHEEEVSLGILAQYPKRFNRHLGQGRIAGVVRVPINIEVHVRIGE